MTISRIAINELRGIDELSFEPARLTVLVGRNGVGKSSVIDALLLGSAQNPSDALGRIVRRKVNVQHGARWLLRRSEQQIATKAVVTVETSGGGRRQTRVSMMDAPSGTLVEELRRRSDFIAAEDIQSLRLQIDDGSTDAEHRATFEVAFDPRNAYAIKASDVPEPLRLQAWVRLVDAKLIWEPLTDAFSRAVISDGISDILALLRRSEQGISNLQILTDHDQPYLAATVRDVTMPITLVGDGVRVLARLAFEISNTRAGGVLLIEEPEIHQHPLAIKAIAEALVEASKRDVQVIMSTHSLELLTAIKTSFDPTDPGIPDVALIGIERDELGNCQIVRIGGRDLFIDPGNRWSDFKQRFEFGFAQ